MYSYKIDHLNGYSKAYSANLINLRLASANRRNECYFIILMENIIAAGVSVIDRDKEGFKLQQPGMFPLQFIFKARNSALIIWQHDLRLFVPQNLLCNAKCPNLQCDHG